MKFRTLIRMHYPSTYEFAKAMGVTWPTGRKYETYPITMSINHIDKLSKLIGVDKCELISLAVAENENEHEPVNYL